MLINSVSTYNFKKINNSILNNKKQNVSFGNKDAGFTLTITLTTIAVGISNIFYQVPIHLDKPIDIIKSAKNNSDLTLSTNKIQNIKNIKSETHELEYIADINGKPININFKPIESDNSVIGYCNIRKSLNSLDRHSFEVKCVDKDLFEAKIDNKSFKIAYKYGVYTIKDSEGNVIENNLKGIDIHDTLKGRMVTYGKHGVVISILLLLFGITNYTHGNSDND